MPIRISGAGECGSWKGGGGIKGPKRDRVVAPKKGAALAAAPHTLRVLRVPPVRRLGCSSRS